VNIPAITILGLGPGSFQDLTQQAFTLLQQAAEHTQLVYFRTLIHPTIEPLKKALPDLQITSFDQFYDESDDWLSLYQQISDEICNHATLQPLIYAVPGHPLIGESSVQLILHSARERGLTTRVIAGLSFFEPVCTLLELDPFDLGTQIIDATTLATLRPDEIGGKIIPTTPLLVAQVYNRRLASAVKLALNECYPDEWPIKLVRAAGVDSDEAVIEMPLYELDHNTFANHLSTLYVPPVGPLTALKLPETQRYIIERLRRDPDGCPWDRKQTHDTLKRYLIEETYEVVEALEEHDLEKLAEELGDVLLQVYLHSEVARQDGNFNINDVYEHINAKLIRRHPHIFGTTKVSDSEQVVQNWETIKKQERAQAGKDVQQESILDGVPPALPALMVTQEYEKRVTKVGFVFPTIEETYDKLAEELLEVQQAQTPQDQLEELGDLLFMVVEIAHALNIDAEEALRLGNLKFRRRFQVMETIAREANRPLSSFTSPEWGHLWQLAKQATKP
jgi:tetrapyrrole methylase family protein/MazG family protein